MIGWRPIRWEENVAHLREIRNSYGKLEQREHTEDLVIDYKTWKMSPKDIG